MADPKLASSLVSSGYTGVTGNTPYKPATPEQTTTLQNITNDKSVTTVPRTVSSTAISLNVNFDGTHNNGLYPATGESPTNIYRLSELQGNAPGADKANTFYLSGVGAQTMPSDAVHPVTGNPMNEASPSNWQALPMNAGTAATSILTEAFYKLEARINTILADNPNAEIAINLAGFSRGGAEATAFANMLNERGIGPFKAGDVRIANLLLLDPVDQTNGALNVKPPTNVDNTLVMVATGEARSIMPAMVVSDEARVIAIPVAHSGLGGSYNPQGTAAVALQKAREFMEAGGSPVAEIPENLRPDWSQMFIHNSSITPNGVPKLGGSQTWDTDEPNRRYEGTGSSSPSVQDAITKLPTYSSVPPDENGTAAYIATYPSGKVITKITENNQLAEVQISQPSGNGSVTTAYDSKGGVKTSTTISTDEDGNKLTIVSKADGSGSRQIQDTDGHVTSQTTITPVEGGGKAEVTQADGKTITKEMDSAGHATRVSTEITTADGKQITTTDGQGNLQLTTVTKQTLSGEESTVTDAQGKLIETTLKQTDESGNHLTTVTKADGSQTLTLTDDTGMVLKTETIDAPQTNTDGALHGVTPKGVTIKQPAGSAVDDQNDDDDIGAASQPVNPFEDTTLTPAQQTALAAQLTAAGLTLEGTQVIPLASGGYLIANSEGELVGSTNPLGTSGIQNYTSASGQSTLLAPSGAAMTATQATLFESTGIDLATPIAQQYDQSIQGALSGFNAGAALNTAFANWNHLTDLQRASALLNAYNSAAQLSANSTPVPIINEGGTQSPLTPPPSTLATQAGAALNLLTSAQQIGHWDQMSDMARAQALSSLVSSGNSLALSFKSGDADFGQSMGQLTAGLSFADALAHGGDRAILTSGLQFANAFNGAADQVISNWVADATADAAVNAAAGTAGGTIPYVGIAMAVMNLEHNPGQAIGSLIGVAMGFGPIGSMVGGMIGGALGGMFGGHSDPPPPPEGIAHIGWSDSGGLAITTDRSVSGGGTNACALAKNVCDMLCQIVEQINSKNPDTPEGHLHDIAINPSAVPKFGADRSGSWMEVTQADGSSAREQIFPETFSSRLIEILQQNGGLAPAWQVETIKARYQQEAQSDPQEARAHAAAGAGGHANHGNQAFALQGNAVESADFKTQSFGALIVHAQSAQSTSGINDTLNQIKTLQVLRDVEQDSYLEKTEWVSGTDANGQPQGILVLDFNGDGQFETRDILNLGGNQGQAGNHTDEANQATANAALQRNNANWLDANGDGVLDKNDPAFAAIKLFIDANSDGQTQAGEAKSLTQAGIQSINLATGQVTYADGRTDKLTAKQLTADTEGIKVTQIQEVQPDGTLKTLNAGQVLEHEGYQGQVQITDAPATKWASANKWGRVQVAACRASSPDPNWLVRVADRPMAARAAGWDSWEAPTAVALQATLQPKFSKHQPIYVKPKATDCKRRVQFATHTCDQHPLPALNLPAINVRFCVARAHWRQGGLVGIRKRLSRRTESLV
jgi:hypothetical protein